ncbi:high-affinity nicotinic acid transporter [Cryptococcus neoformans Bt1]|nr:high-affinity nicotinic acid transporter [Cryptococcus neoformans var. grubii Bt1]
MGAGYFATFLITAGAFTPPVLFHTWHQWNDASEDGRMFRVGSYTSLPGEYRRYRLHQHFPSQMGTGVPRTTGYHRRYRSLGTWTDHRVENVDVL